MPRTHNVLRHCVQALTKSNLTKNRVPTYKLGSAVNSPVRLFEQVSKFQLASCHSLVVGPKRSMDLY